MKQRRVTHHMIKRLDRYVNLFYLWRYMEDGHPQSHLDHHGWRGIIPANIKDMVYDHVIARRRYWQCVTVTYCRDPWGKEYRLLGYARTRDPIQIEGDGFRPLVSAANQVAEENANEKHIYARAVLAAPVTRAFPSLASAIRGVKQQLRLSEDEIQEVIGMEQSKDDDTYSWNETELANSIEEKIAGYL